MASIVAALSLAVQPALAAEARQAAMVIDANTGAVLYERNADEPRFPASLTKMMTLYLTFELVEAGRLSMTSKLTISQEAASTAPSKLELEPGEEILVADAIKALVTKSANDIAVALAERIGGSEANFARLMTEKARSLGMRHTTFRNASGLPDPGQQTTARDMLTLALHLEDDFPRYYSLFSLRAFTYNGATYRNHNTLLFSMPGVDGLKTGYTRASGFNVVTSLRREGRHVVGAVFGGASAGARNAEMRNLLIRGIAHASSVKTRRPQLIAESAGAKAPADKAPAAKVAAKAEKLAQVPAKTQIAKPVAAGGQSAGLTGHLTPDGGPIAPAPHPANRAARVASVADLTPAVAALAAPVEPALATPAAAEPAPGYAIEVAKVRRVMVAPRRPPAGRETASIDPARTTDMFEDTGPPVPLTTTASLPDAPAKSSSPPTVAASPPAAVAAPVAAEARGAPPIARSPFDRPSSDNRPSSASNTGRLDQRALAYAAAEAAQPSAAEAAPSAAQTTQPAAAQPALFVPAAPKADHLAYAPAVAALPERAAPSPPPSPPRTAIAGAMGVGLAPAATTARPPSTLTAQAAAFQSSSAPRPVATAVTPAVAVPRVAGAGFHIQVGAFASESEASRQIDLVKARAGAGLARYQPVTLPVLKGGRQLYRARFAGFDAKAAAGLCNALRQQQIDCYVMRAE